MAENQSNKDALQRLLEDPEIIAAGQDALPQSDAPPSLPAGGEGIFSAIPAELLGKLPMLMSALGPMMSGSGDQAKDDKTALLLALKPYMSPQRCDAIDKLIMFSRLSEIMRQLH